MQSPVPTMQSEITNTSGRIQQLKSRCSSVENTEDQLLPERKVSSQSIVLPYKPLGPDLFPIREPRHPHPVRREFAITESGHYHKEPEFRNDVVYRDPDNIGRLETFLLHQKYSLPLRPTQNQFTFSRANYEKLTRLFHQMTSEQQRQSSVTQVNVNQQSCVEEKKRKIPRRQFMLEMKQVIHQRLQQHGLTTYEKLEASDEVDSVLNEIKCMGEIGGIGMRSQIQIFTKAAERTFQKKRSSTSAGGELDDDDVDPDSIITPAELAVLNCLMEGGFVLSLKAYFIPLVPDLSPLAKTLVYLNLSFNELEDFPYQVLVCRELHVLKFRDNPLKFIPPEIAKLTKLRTFIASFCCLTSLPETLYTLSSLEFLDISYNKLTELSNDIKRLTRLRFLNVEGNELPGLPCGALRLNLFRIRVRNNFMSSLWWRTTSRNSPQTLKDMCRHALQATKYHELPVKIIQQLSNFRPCDCCEKMRYGPGLRILRPCNEIWGIKRIPFLFQSCSPACYANFVENSDPIISEMIYGQQSDEMDDQLALPAPSGTATIDDDLDSLKSGALSLP